MIKFRKIPVLMLSMTAPLVSAAALEEVIVTAQKRAQGLQDVPISINAISGDRISNAGIDDLQDLSGSIPNLQITQTGITNQIGMRGIYSGSNKGFEQSVAMYVDDVYYGRGQLIQLPLVDLERVEVLRGPQPTLFGKNAIAGAISIVTKAPTDEFEASITGFYEFEHEEKKVTASISGPITDNVRGRLVVNFRDIDGWMENTNLNRTEPNSEHQYIRGAIAWDLTDSTTVTLKLEKAEFDNIGRSMETRNPLGTYTTIFPDVDVVEDYKRADGGYQSINDVENAVLKVQHEFNEFELTSVTAYLGYDTAELLDVDYIARDFLDGTNQSEDFSQFSQEIRISSPVSDTLEYIAGIYYQDNELTATDEVFFGADLPIAPVVGGRWDRLYQQDSKVWSVFAQFDWHISDTLNLTVGARYSDEDKNGSRNLQLFGEQAAFGQDTFEAVLNGALGVFAHDLSGSRAEEQFSPLVNLQWDVNDVAMMYISYTQGSKAGGFDIRSNSFPGNPAAEGAFEFEDEQADSYELGAKFRWDSAELNIAAYRTEYEDLQITVFDGALGFNVQNAAEATVQGVELDGRIQLNDNLLLGGSLAYLDFEYGDYDVAQCPHPLSTPNQRPSSSVPGLCNQAGQTSSHAPELSASINLEYVVETGAGLLSMGVNGNYSDEYFAHSSLDQGTIQKAYTKWGVRLALASLEDTWQLALIGDNITDERIVAQSTVLPLASLLTGGTGIAYYGIYERPRNIAVQFTYNFH